MILLYHAWSVLLPPLSLLFQRTKMIQQASHCFPERIQRCMTPHYWFTTGEKVKCLMRVLTTWYMGSRSVPYDRGGAGERGVYTNKTILHGLSFSYRVLGYEQSAIKCNCGWYTYGIHWPWFMDNKSAFLCLRRSFPSLKKVDASIVLLSPGNISLCSMRTLVMYT